MDDFTHKEEKPLAHRLRLLILFRLLVVTFLLGTSYLIELRLADHIEEYSLTASPKAYFFLIVAIFSYLSGLFFFLLFKFKQDVKLNVSLQATVDLLAVTLLVFFTGGITSSYSLFYILIIIYTALFLTRRETMLAASTCSVAYGLLFVFDYYQLFRLAIPHDRGGTYEAPYVLIRYFVHLLSFYLLGLIASYLVDKERKVSSLLEERDSAFAQLNLLHRRIIESVDAGIVTVSLSGRIKLFNRAAAEITGLGLKEVLDCPVRSIFPNLPDPDKNGYDQPELRERLRWEMPFQTKDDRGLYLGMSISPLVGTEGEKIGEIIIFQNLTTRKQLEEALEKNRRLAFIGEMAAALAHEIRNPLAAISGSIQMLAKSHYLSRKEMKLMDIVLRGKQQIEDFMRDFLLLARPAPERDELVDVGELLREVVEPLPLLPDWSPGHHLELNLEGKVIVKAKRMEIRQLLINLIHNAVQAMPKGGTIKIDSRRQISFGLSVWRLAVSDEGVGIDKSHINMVMQPFFTTRDKGTGLGLAIVNRIVTGYSGAINIESIPGQGSTFTVTLPAFQETTN